MDRMLIAGFKINIRHYCYSRIRGSISSVLYRFIFDPVTPCYCLVGTRYAYYKKYNSCECTLLAIANQTFVLVAACWTIMFVMILIISFHLHTR